jgi:hypothetical protein
MFKIYFLFFILVFTSCSITNIRYIGKTLPETSQVDVYVESSSIKQPFEYIGKGYVAGFGAHNPEKIQQKSIRKARKNGADAILITDYERFNDGTSITSTRQSDSIGRSLITTRNTVVTPIVSTGFTIHFLKYHK